MENLLKNLVQILMQIKEENTSQLRLMIREELALALKPTQSVENTDKLYTRAETQALLHVCSTTLWHYERSGFLSPVRLGKRVFYKQSDIDKAMK